MTQLQTEHTTTERYYTIEGRASELPEHWNDVHDWAEDAHDRELDGIILHKRLDTGRKQGLYRNEWRIILKEDQ